MVPSNDQVGRQANLAGRTQSSGGAFVSKGLHSDAEAETVSNGNSAEAGTVFAGLIWEILVKHI